jgi:hypothetical protein
MLDKLNEVDWSSLRHAYGPATDVPGLLRALLSASADERKHAIGQLFGNIWHQGTIYPATAAAVPWLYELLSEPVVEAKSELALLLASIAVGRGYWEVHATVVDALKQSRGVQPEQRVDTLAQEKAATEAARRAISAQLPLLIAYLRDDEPELREAVAEALGQYPAHVMETLPALESALVVEKNEEVRAALEESIRRLCGGNP